MRMIRDIMNLLSNNTDNIYISIIQHYTFENILLDSCVIKE